MDEADYALVEAPPPTPTDIDDRIAAYVAERVPNRATIQTGSARSPTPSSWRWRTTRTSACTPN